MIKMVIPNSLIVIAFLVQSCSSGSSNNKAIEADTVVGRKESDTRTRVNTQSDTLILQWRNDSLGCNKFRSFEKADAIVIKYGLRDKPVSEIIALLGEPNKKLEYKKNGIILRYYYNTCCLDGKLNFECDYSWWDFIFDDTKGMSNKIGGGKI